MRILIINCGSSSLKYQFIDMENEFLLAKGLVERIGMDGSVLCQNRSGEKYKIEIPILDHKEAISFVLKALLDEKHGVISDVSEIDAIGHRVVHGGEFYSQSVIVDDTVIQNIKACVKLAPLHNPANLIGIEVCKDLMPSTPMVAVFDTAFHQTMPEESYVYALPYELYTQYSIRKYGFHGTSHKYVSEKAAEMLNKNINDLKIITCHLGNGASITAIKEGKSIDTSMGFTPLEGIPMGTRSGSIDPAIVTFMIRELNLSVAEIDDILNKKSGVYGISGISSDFRDIEAADEDENKRAHLALEIFYSKVKKYIGYYAAAMGGVDCIVYTAGLGENSPEVREKTCRDLEFLGVSIDKDKNKVRGQALEVSTVDSKVKVLVIPTNEELMIAKDTQELVMDFKLFKEELEDKIIV
ncbi:acetate kinase [Clostridium saccharoperbutylacetonicum]|uniref:acetate kinase n=1 Tax=Clostridium saccharoperbutylacetonicum TaxID=36745 RepID=UPI000983A044|nr:acetate kinase [Clostridium saccharoperbutylacetonicum]AQR95424.1 acetate kinase [Clostridium saccharoperbutylacetonicum]NSB31283.1 acetate kinase [Clostridium saccharoperbutylacetonicum]